MKALNQYMYYALIAVISLLILFVVPLLGTGIGLSWNIPNTPAGWIVWSISNVISTVLNVLLFHGFVKQGKLNILNDKNYIKANELLNNKQLDYVPKSPSQWHRREYKNKAFSLGLFTLLGTIGFSQAILAFDLVKFISQCITLLTGLIFGFMEMKSVEDYWTNEYLAYAKDVTQKEKENNV